MLIVQEKLQLQTKYHVQRPFLGSWRRWKPPTDRKHTWGKRSRFILMSSTMKATFQVLVSHFSDVSSRAGCNFDCNLRSKSSPTPPPVVLDLPMGGQTPSAPTFPWLSVNLILVQCMGPITFRNFWITEETTAVTKDNEVFKTVQQSCKNVKD